MSVEVVLQAVETLAVIAAVGFAIVQLRQYRRDRSGDAAMELLHSFQTADFARALCLVYAMPDGLSKEEIETRCGDDFHLVYALMTTWESLGILVHRGELKLDVVDDFFSGPVRISWMKLRAQVEGEREQLGRETIGEWFQWLAERLEQRELGMPPVPAHVAHAEWSE